MEANSFPVMAILRSCFFLFGCATATAAIVIDSSTAALGAPSPPVAARAANKLHSVATRHYNSECSCCLASQKQYSKTISIWSIMSSKDAKEVLPVIYLARQDLRESSQLPFGWDIDIHFSNSYGFSEEALVLAYETYKNVTLNCLQKTDKHYCYEDTKNAQGSYNSASDEKECCSEKSTFPPDIGVFLVTGDYEVDKVAASAARWQTAVFSPHARMEMMAKPKYSTLYRLFGDDSQLGKGVRSMADQWEWLVVYILYEEPSGNTKCKEGMQSIKNWMTNTQAGNSKGFKVKELAYNKRKDPWKEVFEEIKTNARIVFTCFISGTSQTQFFEEANTYDETTYAFINFDLSTSMHNDYRPWAGAGEVNKTISPRLVVTPGNPPVEFSDKVRNILSDPCQKELQDRMCKISADESASAQPPANSSDVFSKNFGPEAYLSPSGEKNCTLNYSNSDLFAKNSSVRPFAASVYDGVWFFVDAFKRALKDYKECGDFSKDVLKELNTKFESPQKNQTFSVAARILPVDFFLLRLDVDTLAYEKIGNFVTNESIENMSFQVTINCSYTPPKYEPYCGFHGEKCMSVIQKCIIALGCLLAALTIGVAAVLGLNYHSKKMKERVWQISKVEIISWKTSTCQKPSCQSHCVDDEEPCTDKWRRIHQYRGERVYLEKVNKKINLTDSLKEELQTMKVLKHSNIVRFVGACFDGVENTLVTEYCSRGSLESLLKNNFHGCEDCIQYPLFTDLLSGLSFLHKSAIKVHGNLKSSNCLVDSRLVLKLSGFGLRSLRCDGGNDRGKLWTAPEVLRLGDKVLQAELTQEADVYSVGIILNEIFSGKGDGPFPGDGKKSHAEIIELLKAKYEPPYRPQVGPFPPYKTKLAEIISLCWDEDPSMRPTLDFINRIMKPIFRNDKKKSPTLVHGLVNRLEHYANTLQATVDERTEGYLQEKEKWKALLHEILPETVADELIHQRGENARLCEPKIAEYYKEATIYFSDIVDFTEISAKVEPMEVVALLNELYSYFDTTISDFDVYKVETIGDAYVVASGLPRRNGTEHVEQICRMALALLQDAQKVKSPHKSGESLQIRIGINSGPCVAGVTGFDKPRYCIFGDTMNTASRMKSSGEAMKIHISESTYKLLKENYPRFRVEKRGLVELKGKGPVMTYWLHEEMKG